MNHKALKVLEFDKIKEELKKYTQTSAAKDLIDELKPYENAYEVREHLMETKEALEISIKKGDAPFQGLYDAREGISKAQRKFTLLPVQLLRIANLLKCSRRFKSYVKSDDENEKYTVLESITEGIVPLSGLEEEIFKCIIGEEEISDRASTTLFNIRRSLKDKTSSIKSRVNSLIRTYSQHLQENIYTVRGERYVLPVKVEHKGAVPGLVHDQSSSGATLFIEPMSLVDLNNE
ncbi:recombination and DNA strand exchange inhibitor protein, partial [Clostridium botulinum C str. Stockholm]